MSFRRSLLSLSIALACASTHSQAEDIDAAAARPALDQTEQGLYVTAPAIASFIVMEVRVFDQEGNQVLYERSYGEPIDVLASGLADGEYRYQTTTVYMRNAVDAEGADFEPEGSVHANGTFIISDRAMYTETELRNPSAGVDGHVGWIDRAATGAVSLVAHAVGWMVSDAAAANLTASGLVPFVYWDDTDDAGTDWAVEGSSSFTDWRVIDLLGTNGHPVIVVNGVSTLSNNINAFVVDSNGDLRWAESSMYLDKSTQELSLGWLSTPTDFSISGTIPDIRLHDESDTSEIEFELNDGTMRFYGRPTDADVWKSIFNYDVNAPNNSLSIDSDGFMSGVGHLTLRALGEPGNNNILTLGNASGTQSQMGFVSDEGEMFIEWGHAGTEVLQFENSSAFTVYEFNMAAPVFTLFSNSSGDVGLGTNGPAAAFHVERDDGTARILVDENSAVLAPRTLFKLENAGNTKFEILETDSGNSWAFTNSGFDFRISRQGSGNVEFAVDNSGDAFLEGTLTENSDVNAKTNIVAIDPVEVLERVEQLPITQWQYKDKLGVNHIGPMAQDFYAAFELGASETGISTIDTGGVALAAIQALSQENAELKARLEALERQQVDLQAVMARLLEERSEGEVLLTGGLPN